MIRKIWYSLKTIDYRMFSILLLMGLLPTIYTTVRIYFLGDLPSDWGFNIASQLAWVSIIYEVLQEGILLPLFYIIGKSLHNKVELNNKIITGLIVNFAIFSFMAIIFIFFSKSIIEFMKQKNTLIEQTASYIKLETIALLFYNLAQYSLYVIITIKTKKILLVYLLVQMSATILLDAFFISSLPISLRLGVNGIAITNIIVNSILLVITLEILFRNGYLSVNSKLSFEWMKEWLKVGAYSGIESLVRNTAFMLMVLRMVNFVEEQGTFWVANSFIWGWLLLPILQLGQMIKRDCGEYGNDAIRKKTLGYFGITFIIVLVWIISIPLWEPFIRNVMNIKNSWDVYRIAIISIAFYITFAFNNVIDSIFYGIGKTNYMLFQSVVVNTVFYGTLFVLYIKGIYKPNLNLIALMFAAGIAFDSILTYFMFIWMLKKRSIRIL